MGISGLRVSFPKLSIMGALPLKLPPSPIFYILGRHRLSPCGIIFNRGWKKLHTSKKHKRQLWTTSIESTSTTGIEPMTLCTTNTRHDLLKQGFTHHVTSQKKHISCTTHHNRYQILSYDVQQHNTTGLNGPFCGTSQRHNVSIRKSHSVFLLHD